MARFSVIIPILLSAAAFVMSLMVLLAGKDPNFLPSVYLFRVGLSFSSFHDHVPHSYPRRSKDSSQLTLKHAQLNTSNIKPSGLNLDYSSIISSFPIPTNDIPTSIIDQVPSSVIDELAQTAAKKLGLKDYYYSHIMNYC